MTRQAIAALRAGMGHGNAEIENAQAQLMVHADATGGARLEYLTSYVNHRNGNPTRPTAFVDANTGKIYEQWEVLTTGKPGGGGGSATPTAITGLGGNGKLGSYTYGDTYGTLERSQASGTCTLDNSYLNTVNLGGRTRGGSTWAFPCFNSAETTINGAFSPLNDAHYNGQVTNNMHQAWLGRAPLRWMTTPSLDGRSIDNALQFTASMDVHYSSGVYNRAFYLLATTSQRNTRKAFEVFMRANDLYWNATETFNSGACGVERAATDLGYGAAAVTSAFATVGVDCP